MFKPREYYIDLGLPSDERWDEMLADRWAVKSANDLCHAAYGAVPSCVRWPVKIIAGKVSKFLGSGELDYTKDMDIWTDWAVGDGDLVRFAHLSYEVHRRYRNPFTWGGGPFGCTSVSFWQPGVGMVHGRNLDWPLIAIRKHTIIIHFDGESGPFSAVTMPGFVGVLSGVAPGRFSVSLNANEDRLSSWKPNFRGWCSNLLLRYVLQYCENFSDALELISSEPAFAPFFVQLTGTRKGEAAVIAVEPSGNNSVYEMGSFPLGVSNHYPDNEEYEDECWEENQYEYSTDSLKRYQKAVSSANACRARTLRGCSSVMREKPVYNPMSFHSMVMHPKSGEIILNQPSTGT